MLPRSYPFTGNSSPSGGDNTTSYPSAPTKESVSGLKVRSPAIAKAVTSSGDVTKA